MRRLILTWRGRMILAAIIAAIGLIFITLPQGRHTLIALKGLLTHAAVLRDRIIDFGPAAPLASMAVQVLQVVLAPIPGEVSGLVGGYIFGGWPAFWYSTIALTVGSLLAFFGGRFIGRLFPEKIRQGKAYRKFNHLVESKDFLLPLVFFVFPGFPKDSLSYVLGASDMDWRLFIIIAGVGRIPGTLVLSFQGAQVYNHDWRGLVFFTLAAAAVFAPMFFLRHRLVAMIAERGEKK